MKINKRRLLIAAVLGAIGLWLAASGFVAWSFTRRHTAPFPNLRQKLLGPMWNVIA